MAHAHESNTKRIWIVFGLLSVITTVEVALGIIKPDFVLIGDNLMGAGLGNDLCVVKSGTSVSSALFSGLVLFVFEFYDKVLNLGSLLDSVEKSSSLIDGVSIFEQGPEK